MNILNQIGRGKIISAFLVIVIIIIIAYSYYNLFGNSYEEYMYGSWHGDDGFCEASGADSMQLFIGKPEAQGWIFKQIKRPAYLLINNNITNQPINIYYRKSSSGFCKKIPSYSISARIEFEEECEIPSDVTLEFDMARGRLRIHDGHKLYAIFYKNHEISSMFEEKKNNDVNDVIEVNDGRDDDMVSDRNNEEDM